MRVWTPERFCSTLTTYTVSKVTACFCSKDCIIMCTPVCVCVCVGCNLSLTVPCCYVQFSILHCPFKFCIIYYTSGVYIDVKHLYILFMIVWSINLLNFFVLYLHLSMNCCSGVTCCPVLYECNLLQTLRKCGFCSVYCMTDESLADSITTLSLAIRCLS